MNILITSIGSMSADCVISTLKQSLHTIIGSDIYPSKWHAESKLCHKVYQAPLASDERKYIEFLIEVSKENQITHLIPLTDLEIDVINRYRNFFINHNILLCMPSNEVLKVARDKHSLYKQFELDSKVPSIKTYRYGTDETESLEFPCIAKPYNGRSSEGVIYVQNREGLNLLKDKSGYILQEYKSGSVFTVDYVRCAATGHDFSIAREELLRTKNGAGLTVKITNDPSLHQLVSYIGKVLNINGCINLEFIKQGNDYFLIDINPRFSAGVAYSYITGYDMITSHLNCFTGKDICSSIQTAERIITKTYKEVILL